MNLFFFSSLLFYVVINQPNCVGVGGGVGWGERVIRIMAVGARNLFHANAQLPSIIRHIYFKFKRVTLREK